MITIEEVLKTIETIEALLPSIEEHNIRVQKGNLLIFGKEICQTYQEQGIDNQPVIDKLDRGLKAILESLSLVIQAQNKLHNGLDQVSTGQTVDEMIQTEDDCPSKSN